MVQTEEVKFLDPSSNLKLNPRQLPTRIPDEARSSDFPFMTKLQQKTI